MAKRNASGIEQGARMFGTLVKALLDIAHEQSVPFPAIYRLGSADGRKTLEAIVQLAHTDWLAEQSASVGIQTQGDQFREESRTEHRSLREAFVPRGQPSYTELKERFASVNFDFLIKRLFTAHDNCGVAFPLDRNGLFDYFHFGRSVSTQEALHFMQRNGYRPAIYEEFLGYVATYPGEHKKHPIVALGSTVELKEELYVACLEYRDGETNLNLKSYESEYWGEDTRFLAVPLSSEKASQ